jgi:hypothetical protein
MFILCGLVKASRGEKGDVVKGEASAQIQDAKPLIPEVSPRNPESFCRCGHMRKDHSEEDGVCEGCGCEKYTEKKKEGLK